MAVKFGFDVKAYKLSNKPENPAKSPDKSDMPVEIVYPVPFIDRLVVNVPIPTEIGAEVYDGYMQSASNVAMFGAGSKVKGFTHGLRIKIDGLVDAKKWPQLNARIDNKKVEALRLDFVPVDLGPQGIAEMSIALTALVDGGWAFFWSLGKITRLDVTVDIPNAKMDDFVFLPSGGLTSQEWAVDGTTQTYVMGKSEGNQTIIYDRQAKRKKKNKNWPGGPEVRIERRLVGQKIKGRKFLKISNPFDKLHITEVFTGCPKGVKPFIWELFKDSVRQRGLVAALALMPEKQRTVIRSFVKSAPVPFWDVNKIWENWPEVVAKSGIVPVEIPGVYFTADGSKIVPPDKAS